MGKLIIVTGYAGSGKSYFINNLCFLGPNYEAVKKKTTRPPRKNEYPETNVEFSFNCSRKEVENCNCIYTYRDELYGFNFTSIDTVISKKSNAVIIIKPVEVIKKIQKKYKNSIVFLFKPLDQNLLEKQISKDRNTESEIKKRFFSKDEDRIKKEYYDNLSIFDKIVHNKYDKKFLDEIKCFLMAKNQRRHISQLRGRGSANCIDV